MKTGVIIMLATATASACVWYLQAQPNQAVRAEESSRFMVTSAGNTTVMVDTRTGKTWSLRQPSDDRELVWLPIRRIDEEHDAARWREAQSQISSLNHYQERMAAYKLEIQDLLDKGLSGDHPKVQALKRKMEMLEKMGTAGARVPKK